MNKIYKVIWSKVKHQYVVVSELAHSNGKQSRTSRNSIRSRIAALVVCGAIAAFGVFNTLPNSVYAAESGGIAKESQYIAIAIDGDGTHALNKVERDGYSYYKQKVKINNQTKYYYVREGYDISVVYDKRYDGANDESAYIIDAKKNNHYNASSDQGLLQAYQTTTSKGKITTLTGVNIEDLNTGVYGGASNSPSVDTPSDFGYHIKVNNLGGIYSKDEDGYIKVSDDLDGTASGTKPAGTWGNTNFETYFSYDVKLENDGTYSYTHGNEKVTVPTNKVYSIDGKLGVFTDAKGNLYTGDVYGDNNEILLSAVGEGNKIYSYWGTKVNDPTQTIGNMTVQDYNSDRKKLQDQAAAYHGDDITNIAVGGENNNGTISLNRVGQYNDQTGKYETTDPVPGTITVTSTGGNGGSGAEHDVKIKFSNTENPDGFSVDAGSKVEAVTGDNGKVSQIKINGVDYTLGTGGTIAGSFNTQTGEISITQDGQRVLTGRVHDWNVVSGGFDPETGKLTLNTQDKYNKNETDKVEIDGVASTTYVDNKDALNVKYDSAEKTSVTLGGANGTQIHNVADGTDTKDAVNLGQLKNNIYDKYLSTATINKENGTLDLTVTNGNGEGQSKTYNLDLKGYIGELDDYVDEVKISDDKQSLVLKRRNGTEMSVDIADLAGAGLSTSDYHLIGSGEDGTGTYSPDKDGNIELQVKDEKTGTISKVKLEDIASADDVAGNTSSITEINNTLANGVVKYDYDSETKQYKDSVTLKGENGSQIHNVADGTDTKDAVNLGQLKNNIYDKYLSTATINKENGTLDLTVTNGNGEGQSKTYNLDLKGYIGELDDYVDEVKISDDKQSLVLKRRNGTEMSVDIADLAGAGLSTSDYHLIGSGEDGTGTYSPDKDGNIELQVKDEKTGTISKVKLEDIASADDVAGNTSSITEINNTLANGVVKYDYDSETKQYKDSVTLKGENGSQIHNLADGTDTKDAVNLGQLSGKTGDLQYNTNHYVTNDEDLTVSIGKLDTQVYQNTTSITKLQGQTIDGGYVEDGVINLTHKNGDNTTKTVAQIDGLEDYTLQNGQFITKAKDENGKFTGATELTIADKYDPTKTEKVTIDGLVTYNTTQKLDETTGETIVTGIDYDNIRLAGENGTRITNLVDGWVDEKSTDAVNGSQLASVKDGAVKYWQNEDGSYDKSFVQLEGGEDGTLVTHVRDGAVNEYSSDAVNGSQLWETQQQIKDVETTANKHTIVSTPEDSNLTVTNIAKNDEAANYQVELKDDITLGEGNNQIRINGSDNNGGKIVVGQGQKTVEIDNNSITLNKSLVIDGSGDHGAIIHGLSNNNWNPAEKDNSTTAATEGQLYDVYDGSVKYWQNQDGTYDKSFIQLEGGEEGTTITHLKDGVVAEHSTEAINGSQLWETQQQIKDVETTANKHTIVSTTDDSNLTVKNVAKEGEADNYQVTLNDEVVLGDYFDKGNGVLISGNSGTISATNSITVGEDQGLVIDGQKKTIQGLSNTTWTGTTETPNRAATEGQLQNAYDGSVKYWRNEDGTYDKSFIQLEGGEEGTTITHLKDGVVAEYSTEAINGSQLWETQQQIKDVETTANKHTIVSTTKDSNLTVKNVAGEGEADNYQVALKDDITLKGDSSSIELTGTKGTIQVNQETAEGTNFTNINGNVVSIGYTNSEGIENAIVIDGGKGTITGLSNTTWDDELATQVANSEELQGTAATQGQLQQAVSAVATEAAKQHTTVSGDDNLTVTSKENTNGGTNYQVTLNDDITLGNPKAGNTEGERSFTINTTDPEGYVPDSYKGEDNSGAEFIKENGGFMLFATDTQGHGIFGVTAKGSAWAKDFKTYTTDIYGNKTQYSLNEIGDVVAHMSSYYNEENGKSYTVFSRYLNEAEKDNPFVTVDENATRDIPLALRDDGAVLIGATIKGEDFTDNGIRINAETETTYDEDGNEVTNNIATITGLENTEWKPPTPVATFAANDINTTSRAATEAQLDDLYSAVAAYDVNVDGTIDYSHIALAGAPYGASRAGNGTPTGGTSITNVAYASGKDGSEAVNVDYLNDAINNAVKDGGAISDSDRHLQEGTYHVNDQGKVELIVADEKGENQSTVTIDNIANKNDITNLDNKIDNTFNDLNDKINNIDNVETDVKGGNINEDGTISLKTENEDGTTTNVTLKGQLTDSGVVQEGTSFDKETGTITITSQDKYSGETSSVKVEGIASTEVVGATNKEDLATAYKDADKDGNATTEYITDSESMVEADVALDHAIQDVAGTSYANDMVLSNRIDSVEKRLGNVEERIDKVGAMAAAIANLRTMGFDPEAPTEIAIGVGQYKSETGIAIGVFHYPNQDFMLSASLSSSGDELMGGIGATWKLGRKSAAERAKDEEARHLEQAEEMKKLAQQEKVKAQAQRHAKLLAERQQASQKNA